MQCVFVVSRPYKPTRKYLNTRELVSYTTIPNTSVDDDDADVRTVSMTLFSNGMGSRPACSWGVTSSKYSMVESFGVYRDADYGKTTETRLVYTIAGYPGYVFKRNIKIENPKKMELGRDIEILHDNVIGDPTGGGSIVIDEYSPIWQDTIEIHLQALDFRGLFESLCRMEPADNSPHQLFRTGDVVQAGLVAMYVRDINMVLVRKRLQPRAVPCKTRLGDRMTEVGHVTIHATMFETMKHLEISFCAAIMRVFMKSLADNQPRNTRNDPKETLLVSSSPYRVILAENWIIPVCHLTVIVGESVLRNENMEMKQSVEEFDDFDREKRKHNT